jgi:predicted DNA-binding transcriptional regulator AlpA
MPETATVTSPKPHATANTSESLLVAQRDAPAVLGLSRTRFYALKSAGVLPPPVHVPGGEIAYRRADLSKWVANLRPVRRGRKRSAAEGGAS